MKPDIGNAVPPEFWHALGAAVGWSTPVKSAVVEAGHVQRYMRAVGFREDALAIPPSFLTALGPESPHRQMELLEQYGNSWLNGEDSLTVLTPLRIGAVVLSRSVFNSFDERRGSSGTLLLCRFETSYWSPEQEMFGVLLNTVIRRASS